mmetsp:Transcript_57851/g.102782  ORF Transcript_57851/g.102782 Transcript_57851/m.102782 type:complete len:758 (-) Transcript_57851:116-2389(-)
MFLPASRHFHLSDETKEALKGLDWELVNSIKETAGGRRRLNPASVLEHAKECRAAIQKKWASFHAGPNQLCTKRYYDVAGDCWIDEKVLVQIDQKAFGNGAIRECFRMREVNLEEHSHLEENSVDASPSAQSLPSESSNPGFLELVDGLLEMKHSERRSLWVAKRAMKGHEDLESHRRDCSVDVMHQSMAKHQAELYNAALRSKLRENNDGHFPHMIDFLLTHMLELEDGCTYGCEAFLFGNYSKHNNNSGGTMGTKKTPQTFSYFTFINSGRRLMIVDIQGIDDLYTDPVVHFLPSYATGSFKEADSSVNLGIRGFALFLWSHRYNDVDRALGLPIFPLSRAELETPQIHPPATIRNLYEGTASIASLREGSTGTSSGQVRLDSIPELELKPEFWAALPRKTLRRTWSEPLPLDLVEAACHLEISAMYHEGRLHGGSPDAPRKRPELEAAVFHLAEAAKDGLAEAILGLARLASDMEHEDFLPQVVSTENERKLCLALLGYAAELGVSDAHGAAARLMLDGGYSRGGIDDLKEAARHLKAYAEAASVEEASEETELKHEVCCKHGCRFGWESHGWEAHTAYARSAELYENELRREEGAWEIAKELWALAAEIALENPVLAKQAMRYQERADAEEPPLAQEEGKEETSEETSEETTKQADETLSFDGPLAVRFAAFAADFPTPQAALEALLTAHQELAVMKASAKKSFGPQESFDADVWAMMGDAPVQGAASPTSEVSQSQVKPVESYDADVWDMLG